MGLRIPLLGDLADPLRGFCRVLLNIFTRGIHEPEAVLGLRIALLGPGFEFGNIGTRSAKR